jgi:2'-5' RNA ligase
VNLRLFVALPIPAAQRAEVATAVADVRSAAGDRPGLRWPPPERWHLTLAFLGAVDESRVPALVERLGRAARRGTPLALRVEGAGRFDGRVLWAGVHGDVPELRSLATSVAAAARHAGIDVEDRPLRAHLTIARADPSVDLRPLVAELAPFTGSPWTATAVELVRSTLGAQPAYETLAKFPLGTSSDA